MQMAAHTSMLPVAVLYLVTLVTLLAPVVRGDGSSDGACACVQILPINDTRVHNMWWDSYPYKSVSVFALHPIHLAMDPLFAGAPPAELATLIQHARRHGELLDVVDYEATLDVKMRVARAVFESEQGAQCVARPSIVTHVLNRCAEPAQWRMVLKLHSDQRVRLFE